MITVLIILLIVLALINIFLTLRKGENVRDEELEERLIKMDADLSRMDPLIRDEFGRSREENLRAAKENRAEQRLSLKSFEDSFMHHAKDFNSFQKEKFETLITRQERMKQDIEGKLKEIRDTVEGKLNSIREDNSRKLEEMRRTVEEKLQETVEKRFNESFKLISERLEEVHKGLGEMQSLASGVGDLKKVLTNVKTRGNLGEIQLGMILEQILSPEQYEQNAIVKEGSQERVEYVIKLPNRNDEEKSLLLPIDSKFPNEDYQRLIEAYERATDLSPKELETIAKQFEASIKKNAKNIREKYIRPPLTTDFAIMFVPTEGLYAEILRRTGLFECLQREFKITVVGPTNLVAFLSSLQMGFKTLAIEKRSSEVWEILGAVKTEFGRFGTILEKTKKKLQEATNVIDRAGVRSRAIERKLRAVQALPQEESVAVLGEAIETEEET
ncbi:DNA recombination protein RmuC [Tannerella forsythia]|uniref:DNA recombination protein RmuC n=1 Tax=Tannerella forsythia TaxID=28112 RepID=A0A3P1XVC7_TANFO|nr:DNA recombination protein RmuC [Tannerella forsythia]RRD62030.1 DNA recombination protein RmuC [Tannerella forsythia]